MHVFKNNFISIILLLQLIAAIQKLNADAKVHGMIVQVNNI